MSADTQASKSDHTELRDWHDALVELAKSAGREILKVYRQDFSVRHKSDDSPLTAADLAAHRTIASGLGGLSRDNLPQLSEEGANTPFSERAQWSRYWLIDPLDGTREFIKTNGEFTVNIALIEHGRPRLGVVHAPALDLTYSAVSGLGAWKQIGDLARQGISVRKVPSGRPARVLVSRSHGNQRQHGLLDRLPHYVPMSIGSSLKFCLVAEGEADIYPRLGPTSEWDTGAGQCVLEQAGGQVNDLAFAPLRYNTKPSLLNPEFVVIGDPDYDWQDSFRDLQ